jgi:formylmethanofuran dehydrogenase subunit E
MEADIDKLFDVKPSQSLMPHKARILESLICRDCGEAAMESRTRRLFGKTLCIPCFEAAEKSRNC